MTPNGWLSMNTKTSIFALLLMSYGALPAVARPAKCLLEVDGQTFIDGACDFRPLSGGNGDFQITGPNGTYFAYLYVGADGNGTGHWNEEPGSGHAHTPLGPLAREGACWTSETVKLCAW